MKVEAPTATTDGMESDVGACDASCRLPPLRIAMVLEGHFPATGGAEKQALTIARAMKARGHDVEILCPWLDRGHPAGPDRVEGVEVWRLGFPRIPVLGTLVLQARLALRLLREHRGSDAIHVHVAHQMGAVATLVGRLLGLRVVVKFAGSWEHRHGALRPGNWKGPPLRACLRRATAVQATSRRMLESLASHGFPPERLEWLPNAVDLGRFTQRPPRGSAAVRVALYAGRMVPDKGVDVLVEAWALASRCAGGEWHLRIAGPMDGAEDLIERVRELGLSKEVSFAGELDGIHAEVGRADAGVLPSRREGMSNVLLEFLAAGLPVAATRVSGTEDFIEHGVNGWLCEPDDVAGLARVLGQMMDSPAASLDAMGRSARASVEARASIPTVTTRLEALYRGRSAEAGGPC